MSDEPNTRYPGRAEYVGPRRGVCFAIHHDKLCEPTLAVFERIDFIRARKPEWERAERLRQLCMIPEERLPEDLRRVDAELRHVEAEWRRAVAELRRVDAEWRRVDAELRHVEAEWERVDAEWERVDAEWYRVDAEWQRVAAEHDPELLALLAEYVPDHTWNGSEYVLPKGPGR
jgi:Asp-tRNA(Asn)/Glu-tRNA(Gln) amidotransferase A subunit family amidase